MNRQEMEKRCVEHQLQKGKINKGCSMKWVEKEKSEGTKTRIEYLRICREERLIVSECKGETKQFYRFFNSKLKQE